MAYKVYYYSHLDKLRAGARNYWRNHKLDKKEYDRMYNAQAKRDVVEHYSHGTMKCARCGFSDIRALQLDHINGKGKEDRKDSHKTGNAYYGWLRAHNYLDGLQVLCANCNMIKKIENHECAKSFPQRVIPDAQLPKEGQPSLLDALAS